MPNCNQPLREHLFYNLCSMLAVVYDGCPRSFTHGVWWPRTKFGIEAIADCPSGKETIL